MGCIICNICRDPTYMAQDVDEEEQQRNIDELQEEMCNDIATNHPAMVTRINEISEEKKVQS